MSKLLKKSSALELFRKVRSSRDIVGIIVTVLYNRQGFKILIFLIIPIPMDVY